MKTNYRFKCSHEGCREWTFRTYYTQREAREDMASRSKWTCSRHSNMQDILSIESPEKTKVMVVEKKDSGKYFDGFYGLIHGYGHKAYAEDFPVGTKITITAKIELPKEPHGR